MVLQKNDHTAPIQHKLFQSTEKDGKCQNSLYEASITLLQTCLKKYKKKNCKPISHINDKVLNSILMDKI